MKIEKMKESCEIFLKYGINDWFEYEHDTVYGPNNPPEEFEEADRQRLEELGWFFDDESDGWRAF